MLCISTVHMLISMYWQNPSTSQSAAKLPAGVMCGELGLVEVEQVD